MESVDSEGRVVAVWLGSVEGLVSEIEKGYRRWRFCSAEEMSRSGCLQKPPKKWHHRRHFYPTFCLTPVAPSYSAAYTWTKFTTQQQQADGLSNVLITQSRLPKFSCVEGWIGGVVDTVD